MKDAKPQHFDGRKCQGIQRKTVLESGVIQKSYMLIGTDFLDRGSILCPFLPVLMMRRILVRTKYRVSPDPVFREAGSLVYCSMLSLSGLASA